MEAEQTEQDVFKLDWERAGKQYKVTIRWRGEPIHIDTFNVANAAHRAKFIKAVKDKISQADGDALDADLLHLADRPAVAEAPAGEEDELDFSSLVRPEQFFTLEVSGLTVPVVSLVEGEPVAKWTQYLRWADGRREKRELARSIELPSEKRLLVNPIPGDPSPSTIAAWSAASRRDSVDSGSTPEPRWSR